MRYLIPIILLSVLVGVFYRGLYLDPTHVPSPLIGKPTPSFTLPQLGDPSATFGSEDLTGKITLVNVWGSWCPPCWQEHPYLMELADTQSVPIYGLNFMDKRDAASAMITRLGDPYEAIGFDPDGSVGIDWGAVGAPETFLVNADGIILYKHSYPITPEVWEEEFLPLIEAEQASRGDVR